MSPVARLRNVLRVLLPVAVASTIYLYLYPVFLGCAFPLPDESQSATTAFQSTFQQHAGKPYGTIAPFRLLALGDPQLEGDTSIPNAFWESPLPHLTRVFQHVTFQSEQYSFRERIRWTLHDLVDFVVGDIPDVLESFRKRIDLFGNDFYLAHIYRTLRWWTKPTHVTVLGDLLGSQWITDEEFERRGWRYWNRAFRGGERVPDDVAAHPSSDYNVTGYLSNVTNDESVWVKRIINIAGNHDVGYAGDLNHERLDRFERIFGKAAYELRFELPISKETIDAKITNADANPNADRLAPELRIVVVNDMNLDTPALTAELQDHTYGFVNDVINTAAAVEFQGHATIILTHIPLYKPQGVCVDPPFFDFHSEEEGGGVREQYQLSADASKGFLEGIFGFHADTMAPGNGKGRRGIILNGHDHAGCDTWHYVNQTYGQDYWERPWEVARWEDATAKGLPGSPGLPGLREITVRSMMGGFGGNAGMLSAWFDEERWEWRFEFANCALGRQYGWWTVHLIDLLAVIAAVAYIVMVILVARGVDVDAWLEPKIAILQERISMELSRIISAVEAKVGWKTGPKTKKTVQNGNGPVKAG